MAWRARVAARLLAGLLGASACYTYHQLPGAPRPGSRVSLVLTDQGRADAAPKIGPGVNRVEGSLLSATDSAYLLAVSGVQPISGVFVPWAGETVSVRRANVATASERHMSRTRTALITGGAVAALVVFSLKTSLLGIGQGETGQPPPGGGGQNQ